MQQSQKWIMLTILIVLGVYFGTHRTKSRKMTVALSTEIVSQDSLTEVSSQEKAPPEFVRAENEFLNSVNDLKEIEVEKVYPGRDMATVDTSEMIIQESERRRAVQARLVSEVNDGQISEITTEDEASVRSLMSAEGVL